jgi:hypothetical protein
MHARHLRDELRTLSAAEPQRRAEAITTLISSAFDKEVIRRLLDEPRRQNRPLRRAANALLWFLFVVAPGVLWEIGVVMAWIPLGVVLVALLAVTVLLFHCAHLALYPEAEEERHHQFLILLLYPPAAIRACDALSRPQFERSHPLALASVVCPAPRFRSYARQTLLDLRHPAGPLATEGQPPLAAVEQFARATALAAAEALVRRTGMEPGGHRSLARAC